MTKREAIVSSFLEDGKDFAQKITTEYIVEQKMFQLLELEVLKILKISSQENGNFIKLLLLSNILNEAEIDNLEFQINFDPTYIENTGEKAIINLVREDINDLSIQENPESIITYKDLKLLDIQDYENTFLNNEITDLHSFNEMNENNFKNKAHILINDEENDIYIEEVPLYDNRISHIFTKKTEIKILLNFLMKYIENSSHLLTLTALILFEIENLSANKQNRNYYYHDIVDRVNPNKKWFACLDIEMIFLKPSVILIETKNNNEMIDKNSFIQIL